MYSIFGGGRGLILGGGGGGLFSWSIFVTEKYIHYIPPPKAPTKIYKQIITTPKHIRKYYIHFFFLHKRLQKTTEPLIKPPRFY